MRIHKRVWSLCGEPVESPHDTPHIILLFEYYGNYIQNIRIDVVVRVGERNRLVRRCLRVLPELETAHHLYNATQYQGLYFGLPTYVGFYNAVGGRTFILVDPDKSGG